MRERWYALALILALLVLPLAVRDDYLLHVLISGLTIALLALGWNILGGYAGQVSFGHAAFFGLGAYGAGIMSLRLGLVPYLSLWLGSALAVVGALVALPALRLRGAYFSLAMLAYAEVLRILTQMAEGITGGPGGLLGIPSFPAFSVAGYDVDFFRSKLPNYYLVAWLLAVGILLTLRFRYSSLGLGWVALSHDEDAASASGVPVFRLKVYALLASAGLSGLAGAFHAHYIHFLDPFYVYGVSWSLYPLVASYFGGPGTVLGPVLGALGLYLSGELLVKPYFERGYEMLVGAALILAILFWPKGLLAALGGRYVAYSGEGTRAVWRASGLVGGQYRGSPGGDRGPHRPEWGG